ncbi:MAG: hypothetical protein ACTHN3_06630 [Solirubrobacterales bacterium]
MRQLKILGLAIAAAVSLSFVAAAVNPHAFDGGLSTPESGLTLGLLGSVCACGAAALRNGTNRQINRVTLREQIQEESETASPLSAFAPTVTVVPPLRGAAFTQRQFSAELDDAMAEDERPDSRFPIPQYDREALTQPVMA